MNPGPVLQPTLNHSAELLLQILRGIASNHMALFYMYDQNMFLWFHKFLLIDRHQLLCKCNAIE